MGHPPAARVADVVLLVDRLDRLAEALTIAKGARRIALQTVGIGMGLSGIAMLVAAFGYLTPVFGALLQEAIDVAAILNALRVLRLRVTGRATGTLTVTQIAQLGYSTAATLLVIVAFFVVMFTFVEVPIVAFAISPAWTKVRATTFNAWLRRNLVPLGIWALTIVGAAEIVRGLATPLL